MLPGSPLDTSDRWLRKPVEVSDGGRQHSEVSSIQRGMLRRHCKAYTGGPFTPRHAQSGSLSDPRGRPKSQERTVAEKVVGPAAPMASTIASWTCNAAPRVAIGLSCHSLMHVSRRLRWSRANICRQHLPDWPGRVANNTKALKRGQHCGVGRLSADRDQHAGQVPLPVQWSAEGWAP